MSQVLPSHRGPGEPGHAGIPVLQGGEDVNLPRWLAGFVTQDAEYEYRWVLTRTNGSVERSGWLPSEKVGVAHFAAWAGLRAPLEDEDEIVFEARRKAGEPFRVEVPS